MRLTKIFIILISLTYLFAIGSSNSDAGEKAEVGVNSINNPVNIKIKVGSEVETEANLSDDENLENDSFFQSLKKLIEGNASENKTSEEETKKISKYRGCELIKKKMENVEKMKIPEIRKEKLMEYLERSYEICKNTVKKVVRIERKGRKIYAECGILGRKISELAKELESTSGEERFAIIESIKELRDEYKDCVEENLPVGELKVKMRPVKAVQIEMPMIKPCIEKKKLEKMIENLEDRLDKIEDEELKDKIEKRIEFLKDRLEIMKDKCEKREEFRENACERMVKLKTLYDIESKNLTNTSLLSEINYLRKLCVREKINVEDLESFNDLELIVESKLDSALLNENKSIIDELKKIEEEKKALIKEFVKKMKELEIKKRSIIKRIRIKAKQVMLDEINVTLQRLKLELNNTEMEAELGEDKIKMRDDSNITVESDDELVYENGELISVKSNKSIRVLPRDLRNLLKGKIIKAELDDDGKKVRYRVKALQRGRLIGIIPISLTEEADVDASQGIIIAKRRPWWAFLVAG